MNLNCDELYSILLEGEDFKNQFKLNFENIDKLSAEIVAFLNSEGGRIFIGVTNNGEIEGLTQKQVDKLNQWISNASRNNIYPTVQLKTQTLQCDGKTILIVFIPRGENKPYSVNKIDVWIKSGSDKRKATVDDIARLLQESGRLRAEENKTSVIINDEILDIEYFSKWYEGYYQETFNLETQNILKLFNNWKLAKGNCFTLAGLLLFGRKPEEEFPEFIIKAVHWQDINHFMDKEEITGNLITQFKRSMDFLKRNLRRIQTGNVNKKSELEIPEEALMEVVANAIIHRDYFIKSPICIEIWNDRVEIKSPGKLPNTLTVNSIKAGIHNERNPVILSFLEKDTDFRYSGMGKGIPRILDYCKRAKVKVDFFNDTDEFQFKVILRRKVNNEKKS